MTWTKSTDQVDVMVSGVDYGVSPPMSKTPDKMEFTEYLTNGMTINHDISGGTGSFTGSDDTKSGGVSITKGSHTVGATFDIPPH